MILIQTKINGLVILKPTLFEDKRGYFMETFSKRTISKLLNNIDFVQQNESMSKKGVLRGLHFQIPPYAQSKLVRCVNGKILDVAVDLRKNSKTFMHSVSTLLSAKNKKQLFIPKGFAHGFIVLSQTAIISYQVDNYYSSEHEAGVIWNDSDLNINWKIDKSKIILSKKDISLPALKNVINPF